MTPLVPTLLALLLAAPAQAQEGVSATRHNLSVSGPGPVKSTSEDQICIFCHAAHPEGAERTVWNRSTSSQVSYAPYASSTLGAPPGQPDGASRLCLSCHDGTIAVGAVQSRGETIPMRGLSGGGRLGPDRSGWLGTDLSGDHPISVSYERSLAHRGPTGARTTLRPRHPGTVQEQLLDQEGKVQCTSCHDPHEDRSLLDPTLPPFWQGPDFATVCTTCHLAPMSSWSHEDPSRLPLECGSCHVGHGARGTLLLPEAESASCLRCHGGPDQASQARAEGQLGTSTPVRVDDLFSLPHRHPLEQGATGDAAQRALAGSVGCTDCHPIHGQDLGSGTGGYSTPGVRVAGQAGSLEHETCYPCHGDPSRLPYGQTDKSLEFDPSNPSFHPIEAGSPSSGDTLLLPPWVPGDLMSCSDCHGGQDARRGPHGSRHAGLLREGYTATDGSLESPAAYALCYRCHPRSAILANEGFEGHADHVLEASISCYTCHDSHGSRDYPGLIRFGKDIRLGHVLPSSTGRLDYDPDSRSCWLSCHGVDHDPLGYR